MVVSVYSGTVAPWSGSDNTLLLLDSIRRRGLVCEKVAEVRFSVECWGDRMYGVILVVSTSRSCKSGVEADWWIEIFLGVRNCPCIALGEGVRARIAEKMWVVGEVVDFVTPGPCFMGGVFGADRRAGWTSVCFDATGVGGGRGDAGVGVVGRNTGCVISNESEVFGCEMMPVDISKLFLGEAGRFAWIGEVERARGASGADFGGTGGSGRLTGGSGSRANWVMSLARLEMAVAVRMLVGTLGKA